MEYFSLMESLVQRALGILAQQKSSQPLQNFVTLLVQPLRHCKRCVNGVCLTEAG